MINVFFPLQNKLIFISGKIDILIPKLIRYVIGVNPFFPSMYLCNQSLVSVRKAQHMEPY
uniref:Uncharacterized protein n=1 Tax=Anguilla anguilla TaxID=7936 RepID=A0A0E9SB38_ANGAN